jgi:hypothetical protein
MHPFIDGSKPVYVSASCLGDSRGNLLVGSALMMMLSTLFEPGSALMCISFVHGWELKQLTQKEKRDTRLDNHST